MNNRGFTLIEILIVVVVVAILIAIALAVYSDWLIRSRVTEAVVALSQCRESISELYQISPAGSVIGENNWGCGENSAQTQYVSALSTDANGVVQVVLRSIHPEVNGGTLLMTPQNHGTAAVAASIPIHISGFLCATGGVNPIAVHHMPGACP